MYIKFLSITKTLRFRILFPLMLIILSVSFLEIYYLNHYAFTVVEDIVLDTKAKNASQVLNGIERYFSNIETIAKKPLNTIEISSLLRKDYTNLSITEKSKDKYSIQMFLFREIMLPNPDIESSLIYAITPSVIPMHFIKTVITALMPMILISQNCRQRTVFLS